MSVSVSVIWSSLRGEVKPFSMCVSFLLSVVLHTVLFTSCCVFEFGVLLFLCSDLLRFTHFVFTDNAVGHWFVGCTIFKLEFSCACFLFLMLECNVSYDGNFQCTSSV